MPRKSNSPVPTLTDLMKQKTVTVSVAIRMFPKDFEKLFNTARLATVSEENAKALDLEAGQGFGTDKDSVSTVRGFLNYKIRESFTIKMPPSEQGRTAEVSTLHKWAYDAFTGDSERIAQAIKFYNKNLIKYIEQGKNVNDPTVRHEIEIKAGEEARSWSKKPRAARTGTVGGPMTVTSLEDTDEDEDEDSEE